MYKLISIRQIFFAIQSIGLKNKDKIAFKQRLILKRKLIILPACDAATQHNNFWSNQNTDKFAIFAL